MMGYVLSAQMGKKNELIRIRADVVLKDALAKSAVRDVRTEADEARYLLLRALGLIAEEATDAIPASAVLKGTWVRPDGGYTIVIKNVGATGQLEATYFNPNQLPFAKAEAAREGGKLRAFFELRAGGYDGSTYDLAYDPASDRLTGTYYQAVANQRYDIFFARRR